MRRPGSGPRRGTQGRVPAAPSPDPDAYGDDYDDGFRDDPGTGSSGHDGSRAGHGYSRPDDERPDGPGYDGARRGGRRGDSPRGDSPRHDSPRGDGSRGDSSRGDGSRRDSPDGPRRDAGRQHDSPRHDGGGPVGGGPAGGRQYLDSRYPDSALMEAEPYPVDPGYRYASSADPRGARPRPADLPPGIPRTRPERSVPRPPGPPRPPRQAPRDPAAAYNRPWQPPEEPRLAPADPGPRPAPGPGRLALVPGNQGQPVIVGVRILPISRTIPPSPETPHHRGLVRPVPRQPATGARKLARPAGRSMHGGTAQGLSNSPMPRAAIRTVRHRQAGNSAAARSGAAQ